MSRSATLRRRLAEPELRGGPISLLVGIDVGGTKIAIAVGDAAGGVRQAMRRPTEPSGDARRDLGRIAADVRGLLDEAGVGLEEIRRVGVSVPGPLDARAGLVLNPPNLPGWDRAPVRAVLEEALGRPVAMENDANAAALAEWHFGAGQGSAHLVYLSMSTGIGAGLILGGRLHRGVASSAGEVGHMPVEWDGEPCACGLRGCLEAYIGGASWTRRLAQQTPAGSRVADLAGGRARARPEHVVAAAKQGDAFALAEIERFNRYLARALVQLVYVLAPEIFVLGTIAAAAGEALCLEPVRQLVRTHTWDFLSRDLRIEPAALGSRLPELAGLSVALLEAGGDA